MVRISPGDDSTPLVSETRYGRPPTRVRYTLNGRFPRWSAWRGRLERRLYELFLWLMGAWIVVTAAIFLALFSNAFYQANRGAIDAALDKLMP